MSESVCELIVKKICNILDVVVECYGSVECVGGGGFSVG